MKTIAVACYKAKPKKYDELMKLVKVHYPVLLAQNLVTERVPMIMKTGDGSIIEIFEWRSGAAKEAAHSNPVVLKLWNRFEKISANVPISELEETQHVFASFEPL